MAGPTRVPHVILTPLSSLCPPQSPLLCSLQEKTGAVAREVGRATAARAAAREAGEAAAKSPRESRSSGEAVATAAGPATRRWVGEAAAESPRESRSGGAGRSSGGLGNGAWAPEWRPPSSRPMRLAASRPSRMTPRSPVSQGVHWAMPNLPILFFGVQFSLKSILWSSVFP
jgi:hypothetical protein